MNKKALLPLVIILLFSTLPQNRQGGGGALGAGLTALPQGFVYLYSVLPEVAQDIRYYGMNNFVGARIDGYEAPRAILAAPAAEALKKVNDDLAVQGYRVKVFDAYRPQRAVDHFVRWAKDPNDLKMKALYYPDFSKADLFQLGYIARRSSHSRGSTVDLTLVHKEDGTEVDMGCGFDFFGPIAGHNTTLISMEQTRNRNILKSAMEKQGFAAYVKEWWHYTLVKEAYPYSYFDFVIL